MKLMNQAIPSNAAKLWLFHVRGTLWGTGNEVYNIILLSTQKFAWNVPKTYISYENKREHKVL